MAKVLHGERDPRDDALRAAGALVEILLCDVNGESVTARP
jgi:hypothetical protein